LGEPVHRSTAFVRRACAVGTATALIGLTTGFGVMTATTAYAADAPIDTAATAPAVSGGDTSTSTAAGLPADAGTGTGTATTATSDPAPTGTPGSPTAPAPTPAPAQDAAPATAKPAATPTAEPSATPAAERSVKIDGAPRVGQKLYAATKGFTGKNYSYTWSVDGVPTDDTSSSFELTTDEIGTVIRVVVSTEVPDEFEVATLEDIKPNPTFADTTTEDEPLELSATAGEAFSRSFAVTGTKSGDVSYAIGWVDLDSAEPGQEPASQLPQGFHLDEKTGIISGSTKWATYADFTVVATSRGVSATEYVEIDVEAGAPVGVQVFTADRQQVADFVGDGSEIPKGELSGWQIDFDGSVSTFTESFRDSGDGFGYSQSVIPGGQPTVPQGGSLLVSGSPVDRFGNWVSEADGDSYPIAVTSNVASDVVRTLPEDVDTFGYGSLAVTFPHASEHRLTVRSSGFSAAFSVEVVPTATAPVATPPVVTPPVAAAPIGTAPVRTAAHGRLAYTGTDATDSLPWALGMLAAGAALVGLRFARRRAQR